MLVFASRKVAVFFARNSQGALAIRLRQEVIGQPMPLLCGSKGARKLQRGILKFGNTDYPKPPCYEKKDLQPTTSPRHSLLERLLL